MFYIILIDLKRNIKNSIKIVFFIFILVTIISFYFTSINSLDKTIINEEKKLIYDNYYQLIEDIDEDEVFGNIEYDKKEYAYIEDNFNIVFKDSNYTMFVREKVKLLNYNDYNNLIPKTVKSSYINNNVNELYIGSLPRNNNEICIPYSWFINISNNNSEVSLDEVIGLEFNMSNEKYSLTNLKIVGVSNSIFFDIFDYFIINANFIFNEKTILTRYYIDSFSKNEKIDNAINLYGYENKIMYCGNQYGFYSNILKIKNFFSSIYLLVAFPIALSIVSLLIHESIYFYGCKSNIFNQIILLGGNKKYIIYLVNLEMFILSFISLIFSIFTDIILLRILGIIGKSLFVDIEMNIGVLFLIQIISLCLTYLYSIVSGVIVSLNLQPNYKHYEL